MKEEISIKASVDAPLLVKIVDMAAKRLTFRKIRTEIVDDRSLVFRQLIRIICIAVNSRKICVFKLITLSIAKNSTRGAKINLMQEQTALHLKVWVALDNGTFELKHQHRHRVFRCLDRRLIRVEPLCKCRERAQADAITTLENIGILIAERIPNDRCNTYLAAKCRAHP